VAAVIAYILPQQAAAYPELDLVIHLRT